MSLSPEVRSYLDKLRESFEARMGAYERQLHSLAPSIDIAERATEQAELAMQAVTRVREMCEVETQTVRLLLERETMALKIGIESNRGAISNTMRARALREKHRAAAVVAAIGSAGVVLAALFGAIDRMWPAKLEQQVGILVDRKLATERVNRAEHDRELAKTTALETLRQREQQIDRIIGKP